MVKRNIPEVDTFISTCDLIKANTRSICHQTGCKKTKLSYGVKGGESISCKKHKNEDHVIQSSLCGHIGCKMRGKQFIGDHKFCAPHVDIIREKGDFPTDYVTRETHSQCTENGCETGASFDKGKKCEKHSVLGKSDETRRCNTNGCTSLHRPTFGFPGGKRTKCKDHAEDGMVSHKQCADEGCTKSASYGPHGGTSIFCVGHKPCEYILNIQTCSRDGCTSQKSFGPPGGGSMTCSTHKEPGYIDLKNPLCSQEGCDKNRSFGLPNGRRLWCHDHKSDEHVNLVETK